MRPGAPPQSRRYVCTGPGEVSSLVTDPPGTPVTPCKIRSFTSIQMVHTHTYTPTPRPTRTSTRTRTCTGTRARARTQLFTHNLFTYKSLHATLSLCLCSCLSLNSVWQAWHLATSTCILRGRRGGTYGTGLALVARLVPVWHRCRCSCLCGRRGI